MKKIMIIGKSGSGKTSLIQRLSNETLENKKTQSLTYYKNILDTPGEYLENRRFYNALLVSSYEYDAIIFLQSADDKTSMFPPMFSSMFSNKEIIGIVSKIDLLNIDIDYAQKILKNAGCNSIFCISSVTDKGINELREWIFKNVGGDK